MTNALERNESTEILAKLVRSLITQIKSPVTQNTAPAKPLIHAASSAQQQPDLNYLIAISLVAMKRPQIFREHTSLVDVSRIE